MLRLIKWKRRIIDIKSEDIKKLCDTIQKILPTSFEMQKNEKEIVCNILFKEKNLKVIWNKEKNCITKVLLNNKEKSECLNIKENTPQQQ